MSLPALAFVPLAGGAAAAVAQVPAVPGVGQIEGPEGRSLVLGTASDLRRWAASHLGRGRPPAPGRRPKTDLAGIATAIGWAEADGPFRQRWLYERLMAPLVPVSARRDLKPPAFLHLDPAERFPRVSVRGAGEAPAGLFGPLRDRRAAEKARDALHRVFPLRPCDHVFEPDPSLPLGLACLYAQVRSCAAPCLSRVTADQYRALAGEAAAWLADPSARAGAQELFPPTVSAVAGGRALVVDSGRREVGLYPVLGGRVLDAAVVTAPAGDLDEAVGALAWPAEAVGPDDWPWLCAWLRSPRGRVSWVVPRATDTPALLAAVRAALPARRSRTPASPPPAAGDNVGASEGDA